MAKQNERHKTPAQIFHAQQLAQAQANPHAGLPGPVKLQLAALEKELKDANGMVRLYEAENQKDLGKIRDLEHRLTNLKVQLELLGAKQARFVRVDQIITDLASVEKDRVFAEELGICGSAFSLSQLIMHIVAGNAEEAWKGIDVYRDRVKEISARVQTLTELASAPKAPTPIALPAPSVTDAMIAKRVDENLEDRVRAISRDLYERSLSLPRLINTLYDKFVSNRTRFQHLLCARDEIMDDLIARRIDAQLTPARSAVERSLPLVEVNTLATFTQLIQFGRITEQRLSEIEIELESLLGTFDTIRTEYHSLSSSAADIRIHAEEAKRLSVLFGLPCPAEIARQFNETIQRLLLVNIETDQGKRLQNMLAFQPFIKDRVKVIKDFFGNLLTAEAFLLGVNKVSPEKLFRDSPTVEEALKRLFLLTADVANDPNSDRARTKTTLISILQKSGLVQGDEDLLKSIADAQKEFFDSQKVQFYYVWKPKESCRSSAAEFKALLTSPEAVLEALRYGQRKHYEVKYAGKGKAENNND